MHDRLNAGDAGARAVRRARILIVSPWETVWSLGRDDDVKAGVSDDDRFIDAFTRAGYELHFLRPRTPRPDPRVTTHLYPNFFRATRSLPTPLRRLLWPVLFNLVVTPRVLALARTLRPDVILGHSHYSSFALWLCRRRSGIPSVVKLFGVMDLVHTEWTPLRYAFKNLEQLLALKFSQDAWIVLDDGTRGGEILRARGVPAERIHFLPNGLDLEWIDAPVERARAREKLAIPAAAAVVLFLARLVASKRPLDLIRAVRAASSGDPNLLVVFAGDGPLRGACERGARDAGVSERVRFLGTVAHDQVPALMAASDLFVSTSTLTNRALPTCEAMICGVPVVAYDTGDTATVIRGGETGVLVADGNVTELADAIARLLRQPDERARLAAAGRTLARTAFVSWDARIAMEMAIIDALAARR